MRRPISVRGEHPAEQMIPDVYTAAGSSSNFPSNWGYFCLFKSSSALDVESGFKMVLYRLLAENMLVPNKSAILSAIPPKNS